MAEEMLAALEGSSRSDLRARGRSIAQCPSAPERFDVIHAQPCAQNAETQGVILGAQLACTRAAARAGPDARRRVDDRVGIDENGGNAAGNFRTPRRPLVPATEWRQSWALPAQRRFDSVVSISYRRRFINTIPRLGHCRRSHGRVIETQIGFTSRRMVRPVTQFACGL